MTTITERVAKGAALLDEKIPAWVERIDLDTLDINSCFSCVLGQVFDASVFGPAKLAATPFGAGRDYLGLDDRSDEQIFSHGFDGTGTDVSRLSAAWHDLIAERRSAS